MAHSLLFCIWSALNLLPLGETVPSCNNIHQLMSSKEIIILASVFLPPLTVVPKWSHLKKDTVACQDCCGQPKRHHDDTTTTTHFLRFWWKTDGWVQVDEDIFRVWPKRDRISNSNSQGRFIGTFPPLCTRLAVFWWSVAYDKKCGAMG